MAWEALNPSPREVLPMPGLQHLQFACPEEHASGSTPDLLHHPGRAASGSTDR